MTYEQALTYIHSMRHGGPDFARMRAVLERLGDPDRELKILHVAGTNGKGSVCAYLESILRSAGYKTGLFTSPFVRRFNERIRLDGRDIPDGALAAVTAQVRDVLRELDAHPAEFELVTLLGLTAFRDYGVDAAVVEVGMGGVHDATNVIAGSEISVITSIGLDHTQYLGNTLEEIAGVKAGIIRKNGVCAAACDPGGVIARRCRELGTEFRLADLGRLHVSRLGFSGAEFSYDGLEGLRIPLAGEYQPENAALAVTAVKLLRGRGWRIPDEAVYAGLAGVSWPGRLETVCQEPLILVDGGHNPPAARALAGSLKELAGGRRGVFLIGVMGDKDASGILDALGEVSSTAVCVRAAVPRAMDAGELARLAGDRGFHALAAGSIPEAVRLAVELAGPDGWVCAAGSLYILEDVRQAVKSLYLGD